jgi:hypothetical protein
MRSGMKVWRDEYAGAAQARTYMGEGAGVAERYVASAAGAEHLGALDGDRIEAWIDGLDPDRIPRSVKTLTSLIDTESPSV